MESWSKQLDRKIIVINELIEKFWYKSVRLATDKWQKWHRKTWCYSSLNFSTPNQFLSIDRKKVCLTKEKVVVPAGGAGETLGVVFPSLCLGRFWKRGTVRMLRWLLTRQVDYIAIIKERFHASILMVKRWQRWKINYIYKIIVSLKMTLIIWMFVFRRTIGCM